MSAGFFLRITELYGRFIELTELIKCKYLHLVEWECAEKHPNWSLPDKSTKFGEKIAYDML